MTGLLLRGGHVLTGDGRPPLRADVLVEGDRVTAVLTDASDGAVMSDGADGGSGGADGTVVSDATVAVGAGDVPPDVEVIDASGRLVLPGFVDAHSHAEGVVFDEQVQLALLRQGVTTVIGGQDGVSYAPGDGAFASRYFAPINGAHPGYTGPRVADLLASYDGRVPLRVAYLVPAGTVRHEVMGGAQRPATAEEIAAMTALVAEGIEDGAVGLSTGLDYAPGIFADAAEIAALCAPLAPAGLPYVTHMRGGYELNAQVGVEEAAAIGRSAGVPVHLSHFHTPAAEAARLMTWLEGQGVSGSFDAYPYTRGCSLLAMTMLPPEWNALDPAVAIEQLADPARREELRRDWFPQVARNPSLGPEWAELITLAHTAAPQLDWAPGLTLARIAERRGTDPVDAALDVLLLSHLDANVVMAVQDQRPVADLGALIAHPAHMGGSDGIFIGAHPHPRARGTFAAYLATYVLEHGHLDWPTAVQHLATAPADRFHLGDRGRIRPGAIADLILVDPHRVREAASYDSPLELAEGIDDVVVGGRPVLRGGRLTGETPGGGVRATAALSPQHPRTRRTMSTQKPVKQAVITDRAPQPAGPYSQGIISGDLLFTAGFGPQDRANDNAVAPDVAEQTRQVLRNIQALLAEHGATLDDVLKTTVHLADLADFAEFNDAYREFFTEPYPVRTTVGSQLANILVEIDVVARIGA